MVKRIGRYEIQAELGRGGFGQVFRAYDPTVGRLVAIRPSPPLPKTISSHVSATRQPPQAGYAIPILLSFMISASMTELRTCDGAFGWAGPGEHHNEPMPAHAV